MIRVVLVALAAVPFLSGRADAALVYEAGHHAIVAARNDGAHPRVIAHGFSPQLSPGGRLVAYFTSGRNGDRLSVVRRDGHHRHVLLTGWSFDGPGVAWSPDDRYLVAAWNGAPPPVVARLVDVRRRTVRRITQDWDYAGATFAPDGDMFVLETAGSGDRVVDDELRLVDVAPGKKKRYFADGNAALWGLRGIAYEAGRRLLLRKHVDEQPETILGRQAFPIDWSADGNRLLAWENSQFTRQAVLIDLSPRTVRRVKEPIFPVALSRDGSDVLGEMDGDVVERTSDGTIRLLASDATSPSWTK